MALRIESAGGGCPVTELTGQVPDQAALIGILNCLIDKRLSLLSVELAMEKH
jgi:hypothetical protein